MVEHLQKRCLKWNKSSARFSSVLRNLHDEYLLALRVLEVGHLEPLLHLLWGQSKTDFPGFRRFLSSLPVIVLSRHPAVPVLQIDQAQSWIEQIR